MADDVFTPILYLKAGCPHCLKLRLFLLEAGLLSRFTVCEFAPGTPEERDIRALLEAHISRPTFPTAQVAPGEFLLDSDAIIARYAAEARIDPGTLPVYTAYFQGIYRRFRECRQELAALKQAS